MLLPTNSVMGRGVGMFSMFAKHAQAVCHRATKFAMITHGVEN